MKPTSEIYAATLVLLAVLAAGCNHASAPTDRKTQWMDPNQLQVGPIQHQKLTDAQMARVERLEKTFSEVDDSPVEKWVEDFKRDLDVDKELATWEAMATAYEKFTSSRHLNPEAKREVFQVVILRSGAPEDEVLKNLELKVLTEKDAKEIMALFVAKPEPINVISQ